jgi:ArsR family transcriptional regulator
MDTQRLAGICKALAHPARISIVAHLKRIDQCVCGQLVDALPLAQSTVSQHLKILKSAGVVKGEIEGPRTCYCLDQNVMAEFKSLVDQL